MDETHPAIIDARLAMMTIDVVKFIALVMRRLRNRLRHHLLLLRLLLEVSLVLAGFDGDAVCCGGGYSHGLILAVSRVWLQ
jgi:hypothetical protein